MDDGNGSHVKRKMTLDQASRPASGLEAEREENSAPPLEGIHVLALEHAVAGPLCTRHLADLGANVIKIERPSDGDFARGYDNFVNGMSSQFIWLNRGKRSVALDIKDEDGRRVLSELIDRADVVVQNLAPGAASRLGISHEALRLTHPHLVLCDISGYGESGPMAQRKAYDLLIQAESGLIHVTGTPEEPCRTGISIADIATGMYAFSGILAALIRRGTTGQGGSVKVAMLDALSEWMTWPMLRHVYQGSAPLRIPIAHPSLAPYGRHRTKDGSIIFGIQNEREWKEFCTSVLRNRAIADDPQFASQNARRQHREELTAVIEDYFGSMTTSEVTDLMDRHGIATGRLNTPIDVWEHEQFTARDKWRNVQTEAGSVRTLLPPFHFDGFEARMDDVPAVGQHTDEVLAELGFKADAIASLHARRIV